jgi:hypothetical protein
MSVLCIARIPDSVRDAAKTYVVPDCIPEDIVERVSFGYILRRFTYHYGQLYVEIAVLVQERNKNE